MHVDRVEVHPQQLSIHLARGTAEGDDGQNVAETIRVPWRKNHPRAGVRLSFLRLRLRQMFVPSEHHRREPQATAALYDAFCKAPDVAMASLYDTDALRLTLPWLIEHVEEARRVLGESYWAYGVDANRDVWTAFCNYQTEQELTTRSISVDELFVVG